MGFLLAKADIDGTERLSVIAESALPHLPQWTAVDKDDVRDNPWDFQEPEPEVSDGATAETTGTDGIGDEQQAAAPTEPATPEDSPATTPKPSRRKATTGDDADTPKE